MRPTGRLHIGHYHGALKNWIRLQHQYDCYFFVADFHALTTHYQDTANIEQYTFDTVVDWLAAGLSPSAATIFVQSKVPEHAELHLLLSMITPVPWLERVPSYKDQQANIADRDLGTYGFLGYPVLQAADVLMYRAGHVPVGADQVAHLELAREIARRFNHIFGREPQFETTAEQAIDQMGKRPARLYRQARRDYLEKGDTDALARAKALLGEQQNLSIGNRERLFGYLEGSGRIILPEPNSLLTGAPGRARHRRTQDVEVLRQRHRSARESGLRGAEDQDHGHRSGPRPPGRSGRSEKMPGLRSSRTLLRRRRQDLGRRRMPKRQHRLRRLQATADRCDQP